MVGWTRSGLDVLVVAISSWYKVLTVLFQVCTARFVLYCGMHSRCRVRDVSEQLQSHRVNVYRAKTSDLH